MQGGWDGTARGRGRKMRKREEGGGEGIKWGEKSWGRRGWHSEREGEEEREDGGERGESGKEAGWRGYM